MKYLLNTVLCIGITSLCFAQNPERADRIKAVWIAYITQELPLSSEEATKFWPIYKEFKEKERSLQRSARLNAIKTASEAEQDAMIMNHFKAEEQLLALRKENYLKFKNVISSSKIIRLRELEKNFKKKVAEMIRERSSR